MAFDELVVSFLVDEVVGGFFINVSPGHIACIYDMGRGVLKKVLRPGLHLKIPFWQRAKLFNAQILEYTIRDGFKFTDSEALGDEEIRVVSKDKYIVSVEGTIIFKLDKTRAYELWENIGDRFVSKVVRPVSRSRIRSVFSEIQLEDITNNRLQIEQRIKEVLSEILSEKGLLTESVLLSEVRALGPYQKGKEAALDSRKSLDEGDLVYERKEADKPAGLTIEKSSS